MSRRLDHIGGPCMPSIVDSANVALAELRGRDEAGPLVSGERLVPGIWFHMDTSRDGHEARFSLPAGGLVDVSLRAEAPVGWCTLNLALGEGDAAALRMIGFAARARAPQTTVARACVRSFRGGAFQDVFFPQDLVAFAEESSHSDVLWTAEHPPLLAPADRRLFLIFFDAAGFEISLTELCLFGA